VYLIVTPTARIKEHSYQRQFSLACAEGLDLGHYFLVRKVGFLNASGEACTSRLEPLLPYDFGFFARKDFNLNGPLQVFDPIHRQRF
jgi:hypothetical protein